MEAWPTLMKSLGGEPAMSVILNLFVTGGLAIISGLVVTIWATQIQRRNGSLMLIMLSIVMLLVGRGLLPPVFGVIAGVIGTRSSKDMISTTTTVHAGRKNI